MKHIAIIDEEFTRDMQYLADPDADQDDDDAWEDWGSGSARIYLGIYSGSESTAKELAAQDSGVDPAIITLIPVPEDESFVPKRVSEDVPIEITTDVAETLKRALFLSGTDAVEAVLGYPVPESEDKDVTDARLDQAISGMSHHDFEAAWRTYVLPPKGGYSHG